MTQDPMGDNDPLVIEARHKLHWAIASASKIEQVNAIDALIQARIAVPCTPVPRWMHQSIAWASMVLFMGGMSSDHFIASADPDQLVGLVMKLTGGSIHPDLPRAQIENARKRAEASE